MQVLLCALLVAVASLAVWLFLERRNLRRRYGGIVDVDAEVSRRREEAEKMRFQQEEAAASISKANGELRDRYTSAKQIYDRLTHEISLLEQNAEDISFGLYKPTFSLGSSEEYKAKLTDVRERQKSMVRADGAVRCGVAWTVGNSKRDGERMQKQYSKLLLRAFNGECDAATAKVAWNNVSRMQERVTHAFDPRWSPENRPVVVASKAASRGGRDRVTYRDWSLAGKSDWSLVRQLRGPHLRTWAWCRRRSRSAVTAAESPRSLPQSSTGRFDVIRVLARS